MDLHRIVPPTPALQIQRLREEGSRQLEEQQRLIQEQIRKEREQRVRGEHPSPHPASCSEQLQMPREATLAARWSLEASTCWSPGARAWTRATWPFFLPVLWGLSASYSARGLLAWYLLVPSRAVSILEQVTGGKTLCFSGRTMWSFPLPPVSIRGSQPFVGRVLTVAFRRLPALGVGLLLSSSAGGRYCPWPE